MSKIDGGKRDFDDGEVADGASVDRLPDPRAPAPARPDPGRRRQAGRHLRLLPEPDRGQQARGRRRPAAADHRAPRPRPRDADRPYRAASDRRPDRAGGRARSAEHTSELQSLMRISYAVLCLKKTTEYTITHFTPPL